MRDLERHSLSADVLGKAGPAVRDRRYSAIFLQRGRAAIQDSRFQIQENITRAIPGTTFARREETRQ
jgi:hypothetical protein